MDPIEESTQVRFRPMAGASSFCRLVYSEIEEIGWERLVRSNDDLTFLSFRVTDNRKRVHILEVRLDKSYAKRPPSISADVPYLCDLKWSPTSKLKDVIQQFQKHLEKLSDFWDVMENIDKSLCLVESQSHCYASSHREIKIGHECHIMFHIDAKNPTHLPDVLSDAGFLVWIL